MAKVGDIVKTHDGMYVATEVSNGEVADMRSIYKYIAKNTKVEIDGKSLTIDEIIQKRIREHFETHEIIDKTV